MAGVNNKGIENLNLETALKGYFFPLCMQMCGGAQKGKASFCFRFISPSQINVKTLQLEEGGMERLAVANTFFCFPLLHEECNSSCLKRNASFPTVPCWHSAQPVEPNLKEGKVFFEVRKTILPCLKHPPSHQTNGYLYQSPKG